jgi:hypothetical protein
MLAIIELAATRRHPALSDSNFGGLMSYEIYFSDQATLD